MFKKWSKYIAVCSLVLVGFSQVSWADDAKTPPPPKWYDTISVSGFVDAYYSYNSNTPGPGAPSGISSMGTPYAGYNQYHNFDIRANDLDLSLVELNIVKPVDDKNKAGFTIGLMYGEAADVISCGGSVLQCPGSPEQAWKNVRQAYASMLLLPNLQLDFGKYVTQMGAEVIESKDNWNYTRSLLYTLAIPYLHTGARLTYTVNDMVFVQGQVDNGWNNGAENNNGKYYGIQLGVTPVKPLPIVINYAVSSEPTQISAGDALSLFDVIVTYNATDSLSFMLNYDNATQKNALASGDASWDGIAVYGRYAITPMIAVALRLEQFNDADGYRTDPSNTYGTLGNGGQKLTEETLTLEHNSLAGCLVRLEYRHDSTNLATSNPGGTGFAKEDGTASQTQDTLTLGVVHTF